MTGRFSHWFGRHLQAALSSLGRLSRQPFSTLLTTGVIAIAVALPTGLYIGVQSVRAFAGTLDEGTGLSLFLAPQTDARAAGELAETLRARADVAAVRLIPNSEAMKEFKALSGFGQALDLLGENPLPNVLLVRPVPGHSDSARAAALADELRTLPAVELVQVDLKWVERLQAITRLVHRVILLLTVLLGLAVLLIVGNTIRLEIQHRRPEIEITRLVGATDAFVRRPFLYEGIWYGLFGAALAGALVQGAGAVLSGPLARLMGIYGKSLITLNIPWDTLATILAGGPLLGLIGAWLAVGRHLARITPT